MPFLRVAEPFRKTQRWINESEKSDSPIIFLSFSTFYSFLPLLLVIVYFL